MVPSPQGEESEAEAERPRSLGADAGLRAATPEARPSPPELAFA